MKKAGGQKLQFDISIEELFKRKRILDFDKEMKVLERERRLYTQRRKELAWKGKRETYKLKKWQGRASSKLVKKLQDGWLR